MTLASPRTNWNRTSTSRLGVNLRDLDWVMLSAVVGIITVGLLMVYSSTRNLVDDPGYFVKRQGVAMARRRLRVLVDPADRLPQVPRLLAARVLSRLSPCCSSCSRRSARVRRVRRPGSRSRADSSSSRRRLAKFLLIIALCGYVNEHRGDIDPWRVSMIVLLALVPARARPAPARPRDQPGVRRDRHWPARRRRRQGPLPDRDPAVRDHRRSTRSSASEC